MTKDDMQAEISKFFDSAYTVLINQCRIKELELVKWKAPHWKYNYKELKKVHKWIFDTFEERVKVLQYVLEFFSAEEWKKLIQSQPDLQEYKQLKLSAKMVKEAWVERPYKSKTQREGKEPQTPVSKPKPKPEEKFVKDDNWPAGSIDENSATPQGGKG
jgi:hypothetical protein